MFKYVADNVRFCRLFLLYVAYALDKSATLSCNLCNVKYNVQHKEDLYISKLDNK